MYGLMGIQSCMGCVWVETGNSRCGVLFSGGVHEGHVATYPANQHTKDDMSMFVCGPFRCNASQQSLHSCCLRLTDAYSPREALRTCVHIGVPILRFFDSKKNLFQE